MQIIKYLIPTTNHNRPGTKIKPTSITVHNTGNSSKSADAKMHSNFIKNTDKDVSWHFTADDKTVIQHIPIDEMSWHAGCIQGNKTSIGIEICMNDGIDMQKAERNAVELVGYLMKETGIREVRKHQDWTGKYCPRIILNGQRWEQFKVDCFVELHKLEKNNEVENMSKKELEDWQKELGEKSFDILAQKNIINNVDGWKRKLGESTPNWMIATLMVRVLEKKLE